MLGFLIFLFWAIVFVLPFVISLVKKYDEAQRPWKSRLIWLIFGSVAILAIIWAFGLYVNVLWWTEAINQVQVFWTRFWAQIAIFFVAAIMSLIFLKLNTSIAKILLPKVDHDRVNFDKKAIGIAEIIVVFIIAMITGLVVASSWESILLYKNQVPFDKSDPVFNKDVGFYVFTLPILRLIRTWLIAMTLFSVACVAGIYVGYGSSITERIRFHNRRRSAWDEGETVKEDQTDKQGLINTVIARGITHGAALMVCFMVTLIYNTKLSIWGLMYSGRGAVYGPGYTDLHLQIPMYKFYMVILGVATVCFLVSVFARRNKTSLWALGIGSGIWILSYLIGVLAVPSFWESQKVSGNKIKFETPYVEHNIEFTREAYGLTDDKLEVELFADDGIPKPFTADVAATYPNVLKNIRLWDWRVLETNLDQTQTFRQYYDFADVDITRVDVNGEIRQVMVCLREMNKDRLTSNTDSKFNRHLVYTHVYGYCMVPTNVFDPKNGGPVLWTKNIPTESTLPGYDDVEARIYYGERTEDRVYVNTKQEEFDYPNGDENTYNHYRGKGGVSLGSGLRKLAFALDEHGLWLLMSKEMTDSTRVLWRRDLRTRVEEVAPFLKYDHDEYAVPDIENNKLYLMLDSYTTTNMYPYSDPYKGRSDNQSPIKRDGGYNYIRNAVKWTLDCYTGELTGYIFDEDDPLIQTWMKIFPTLFKPKSAMPKALLRHIRYPEDLIYVQARIFADYHMTDPQVFINKEDSWEIAEEIFSTQHAKQTQEVLPYYVVTQLPGESFEEFLQMVILTPYTPPAGMGQTQQKKRNNMLAWMAGRCDPDVYGKIKVYLFSKQQTIMGPMMVENRINQDTDISQELSWWGDPERGSIVIHGNLLCIPIGSSVIYVEPVYLQASAGEGIPELKRVAVATQDELVWEDSFEKAITSLIGGRRSVALTGIGEAGTVPITDDQDDLIQLAKQYWENYLAHEAEGQFAAAGQAKEQLAQVFAQLFSSAESVETVEE